MSRLVIFEGPNEVVVCREEEYDTVVETFFTNSKEEDTKRYLPNYVSYKSLSNSIVVLTTKNKVELNEY